MTPNLRPLPLEEIQEAAAGFKEGLVRESRRCMRCHDSIGALAALEGMEHVDNFVKTLQLCAGSRLGMAARSRPIRIFKRARP